MIVIHALDNVWARVECDADIAKELSEYFTFDAPNARYMPAVRNRHWDGRIRLFKLRGHTIYRGLVPRILEFAEQRDYPVTNTLPALAPLYPGAALDDWLATQTLPLPPRTYQVAALRNLLDRRRGSVLSPSASGKSYVIWLLTQALPAARVLIVVPTLGLIAQMRGDLVEYGTTEPIHAIFAGQSKDTTARLVVSTWQSIYELPTEYFNQFDCIVVDEVHLAKAKSITRLMEHATQVPYRFGFTGTLDDVDCHRLILEGLFGTVLKVATTNDLQKAKQLAPLHVKVCVCEYPEQARKNMRKAQYPDEMEFIVGERARTEFIAQMVAQLKGNTLVLFQYIEKHGLYLFERIKQVCANKSVHYIAGSVEADDRERIRQIVEHDGEQVIVASYGTFSTGINITNLNTLVFASPSKSKIRVLQSIGRALRTHEGKSHALLIDVVDDLRIGKHVNHTFRHAEARVQYYASEKFPVTMHKIPLSRIAVHV